MNTKIILFSLLACFALAAPIQAKSPAAPDSYVYIISPQDGEVVDSPVLVKFGLRGMGIAPAGVEQEHTGHHHLLIDVETLPDLDKPIPADDQHIHFGKGQTEALIELSPRTHKLQLLLGDFSHIPHDTAITSKTITINVVE
jgi:hypothetical protein